METRVLSGKEVAAELDKRTAQTAAGLTASGIIPTLAVIRVGERSDDLAYERSLLKRADKLGIRVLQQVFDVTVTEESVRKTIKTLNADPAVHGILLFRPLPQALNEAELIETIAPSKDVDGVTSASAAGVFLGNDRGFPPCTPDAVMRILDYFDIAVAGKKAAVVGRSTVVGRPLAMMLMRQNATVTICHTKTPDLAAETRRSDILVACAGHIGTIRAEHLRTADDADRQKVTDCGTDGQSASDRGNDGQVVIDVGINMTEDGRMTGDCLAGDMDGRAAAYTPVPGGVGSVTVSVLMSHVVEACSCLA